MHAAPVTAATVVDLDAARLGRAIAALYPAPANDPPVAPALTLEAGLRAFLAVEEALAPWADSVLIAALAGAGAAERDAILAELATRGARPNREE